MPESSIPGPSAAVLPEVVYSRESPMRHPGRLIAAMMRDLLASRGLAWRIFIRDLSSLYRQSLLGYFWAFVPPVLAALPWVFLNNQKIVDVGPTPIPYPAFVLAGTMLWQSFLDALNSPLKQTNAARSMLAKINFPKEALLLAGLAETLWNLLIRLVLLIPILLILKVPLLGPGLLLVPVGLGALLLLGLSIGLILTPVGLLYTDVGRGISIIAGIGMLLTPVIYPPPKTGIGAWMATWNPVSPVLVTARDWLTGQAPLYLGGFTAVTVGSLVLLAIAWFAYRLTMPILIERMGG